MNKEFINEIIEYINYLSELSDKYWDLKYKHEITMTAVKDLKLDEQINEKIKEYYNKIPF